MARKSLSTISYGEVVDSKGNAVTMCNVAGVDSTGISSMTSNGTGFDPMGVALTLGDSTELGSKVGHSV